jgi:hypothetical protein
VGVLVRMVAKVLASFYLSDRIDSLHGSRRMMSPEIQETFPLLSLGLDKLFDFKSSRSCSVFRRTIKAIFRKVPLELFPTSLLLRNQVMLRLYGTLATIEELENELSE